MTPDQQAGPPVTSAGLTETGCHLPRRELPAAGFMAAAPGRVWLNLARVLCLSASAFSSYLLAVSLTGHDVLGCGPASGCDVLLHSRWAYWFGLPVSLGAVLVYGVAFVTTFLLGAASSPARRRRVWSLLRLIALLVLGAGAWFLALQVFVLKAFCPYCLTAHGCGFIMALQILARSQVALREQLPLAGSARGTGLLALGGLGLLIGGQLVWVPKTFAVRSSPEVSAVRHAAEFGPEGSDVSIGQPASSSRLLILHDGAFQLDLREVPLLGSPEAHHVMVSLFDYTCAHCRAVYKDLVETQHQFSNELAIVSLPVPLDTECNPYIEKTLPDHVNACLYARVGLAVWLADRGKLAAFDDWMFGPPRPPSTIQAAELAADLVGKNALATALQDPWISRQLEFDNRLCASNYFLLGHAVLPQLIIGTNVISGTLRATDLDPFLASQFHLTVPPSRH